MHTEGDRLQTMSLSGDPQRTPRIQRRQNFGVLAVRTNDPPLGLNHNSRSLRGQETEEGRAALGPQISPIEHVTTSLPPVRIIHGDADMLVPLGQTRMVHS